VIEGEGPRLRSRWSTLQDPRRGAAADTSRPWSAKLLKHYPRFPNVLKATPKIVLSACMAPTPVPDVR